MSAAFCLYSNSYYLFDYHFFCIVMRRHSQFVICAKKIHFCLFCLQKYGVCFNCAIICLNLTRNFAASRQVWLRPFSAAPYHNLNKFSFWLRLARIFRCQVSGVSITANAPMDAGHRRTYSGREGRYQWVEASRSACTMFREDRPLWGL